MGQRTRYWKRERRTWRWTGGSELRVTEGGKSLANRQRKLQALKSEATIRQDDQCQVPMQAVPASSLEVIQATFLLGIFIKLLDDPTRVSQGDQSLQRGVWGQRAEPVLGLLRFLLPCGLLLGGAVLWQRLSGGRLLTRGCGNRALGEQPALGSGVDAAVAGAVEPPARRPGGGRRHPLRPPRACGSPPPAQALP